MYGGENVSKRESLQATGAACVRACPSKKRQLWQKNSKAYNAAARGMPRVLRERRRTGRSVSIRVSGAHS